MRWSYSIFRVRGISIELHLTFLLFMFLLLLADPQIFLFYVLMFSIVLAHECVHSFTAILHGIRVPRILLTPIGGMASIEMPDDPALEMKVSIVGPLFNFALAGMGAAMMMALNVSLYTFDGLSEAIINGSGIGTTVGMLNILVWWNFVLGAFNMLPAFPMDGGRVFRSVLALWVDFDQATKIATIAGQMIGLTLAFIGLLTPNLWYVLIGLYISWAGGSEARYVNLRRMMEGLSLADLASAKLGRVNAALPWRDFISTVYRKGRYIYLVVNDYGVVKGVLDIGSLNRIDPDAPVGNIPSTGYTVLEGRMKASDALKTLMSRRLILVSEGGKLVGYVTAETLSDSAAHLSLTKAAERGLYTFKGNN
jgi:Zn-dependent protease